MEKYYFNKYIRTILVISQIIAVSFLYTYEWLVFIITTVLAVLFLLSLKLHRGYVQAFFLFGFLGAAAEFLPVQLGAWSYATTVSFGLPAYLPVIWGTAGVSIMHMTHKLSLYGKK